MHRKIWASTLRVWHNDVFLTLWCICSFQSIRRDESQREETYLLTCAPTEDLNQPTHPHSLIRVFAVRMRKLYILGYPKCAQWRFWSDCANVQSDQNLRWAHMFIGTFSDISARFCLGVLYSNVCQCFATYIFSQIYQILCARVNCFFYSTNYLFQSRCFQSCMEKSFSEPIFRY